MATSLRTNTLLSNIAGNLYRAGQHRPLLSGPRQVLLNQETSLHNNLMQSQARRNNYQVDSAKAEEERQKGLQAQAAQEAQVATALFQQRASGKIDDVQMLRGLARLPLTGQKTITEWGARQKLLIAQNKEKRDAELGNMTKEQYLFKTDPAAFAAMQASKKPLVTNNIAMGTPAEQVAELNEIRDVYRKNAQGNYESNEDFLTALESTGELGKADANDMVKRAKASAETALKQKELEKINAGTDVTRQREGVAASTVVDDINDAMKIMEDWGYTTSGTLGRLTRGIAETPAGKVKAYVNSVKSNIGIDTLLKVKKEGSGMGQLPQKQLEELQKVLGPLSVDVDAKVLYQTMKEVKRLYKAVEDNMSPQDRKKVGLPAREGLKWLVDSTGRGTWVPDTPQQGNVYEPPPLNTNGWSFELIE